MKRALKWIAGIVLGLIVVVIVAAWFALSSEGVARWAVNLGIKKAPPGLSIAGVSGRLRGPLRLTGIRYRTATMTVAVDSVLIDWRLLHLLRRQLQLDQLHVTGVRVEVTGPAPVDTAAKKAARSAPHLPVDVAFGDVDIRQVAVDAPDSMRVRLDSVRMRGHAVDYQLTLHGSATTPRSGRVTLTLGGHGTLEQLHIDSSHTAVAGGQLATAGTVHWYPAVAWDVTLAAHRLHPNQLMPDSTSWPATLDFMLATKGAVDSIGPSGTLQLDSLSGQLRQHPLSGHARVAFGRSAYTLDTVALQWGSIDAKAHGAIGDSLALAFAVQARDIGTALPGASGAVEVSGSVGGTRRAPLLLAHGDGHDLRSGANRIRQLTLRADVDMAPHGRTQLSLHADSATLGSQPVRAIALDVTGRRERHALRLSVHSDRGNLRMAASGGYRDARWAGSVDSVVVDSTAEGSWQLQHRAGVTASAALIRVDSLCVAAIDSAGRADTTAAHACLAGVKQGDQWHANVDAGAVPVSWLPLPARASAVDSVSGTLTLLAHATGRGKRISGNATVHTTNVYAVYHQPGEKKPRRLALDSAAITASLDAQGTHVSLGVRVTDAGKRELAVVTGTVTLPQLTALGGSMRQQPLTAHLDVRAPDLAFAAPFVAGVDTLKGSFTTTVDASGTLGAPTVRGRLQVNQLVAGLPGSRSLTGAIDADADLIGRSGGGFTGSATLAPHDLRYNYRDLAAQRWLAIDGSGLQLHSDAQGGHAEFDVAIRTDKGGGAGSFKATATLPEFGGNVPMRAQKITANVDADIPDLAVFQPFATQVDSLRGKISLQGSVTGRVATPSVTAKAAVDSLRALLPFGTTVRGSASTSLQMTVASDSALSGSFTIDPGALAFDYRQNEQTQRVTLDSTRIDVTAGRAGVHGTLAVNFVDSGTTLGTLRGELALPNYTRTSQTLRTQAIQASLTGKISDLSFIRAFSPLVDSAAGHVALDSKLTGTVADSRLAGSFEAHQTTVRLPQLGIVVDSIDFVARGDQAGSVSVNASMRSGGGTLTLAGTSPVHPTTAAPGTLHMQGTNFTAASTAQLRAVVSPDITVAVTDNLIKVRGSVTVPIAHLGLTQIPATAIAPSDDVVFADSVSTAKPGPQIDTDVQVTLGDSVSFSGFNFNAILTGALRVIQAPHQLATASGTVVIDSGTYKAYGQDLTISQGQIQFAGGAINDPALNIRAARTAQDSVVAGLDIRGTLKAPDVTIFSDPAMSQTEALSYIVTGHGIGQGSGSSGNLLAKALSAVGLRGGNAVVGALGHELHLDEAKIEAEGDIKKAAFVAGTYLSPNVYVSYGIGLFDPVSTLRLRYVISNQFTLQAETGKATGADVLIKTTKN